MTHEIVVYYGYMDIHTNIPLKNYTTMRLGGPARFMSDVHSAEELIEAYKNARAQQLPVYFLGGGSNTLARDEGYNGLVLHIRIPGFTVVADDLYSTTIRVGAGEIWDDIVTRTVEARLSGIEALSAIPGTAGAAPVQNIGAYGQEVAETIVSVEAYDTTSDQLVTLAASDCGFSYRHSIFRGEAAGRYTITAITLKLSKNPPVPPFYDALQRYLDDNAISVYTPQTIRQAVTAIRVDKLPDPTTRPNSGSFFKNAQVEGWQRDELLAQYPTMPYYDMGDGRFKIPTGWLIEQTGLKGQLLHGMRVHDKNALVLINESATSYSDLAAAREQIIDAVRDTFRILIEQEPLEMV